MKKLLLILFIIISMAFVSKGQPSKKDKKARDALLHSQNIFSTDLYINGDDIFPRFQAEGYSVFKSGFGYWALAEYTKPMIKDSWIIKGYGIPVIYNLNMNVGASYQYILSNTGIAKYRLGLGYVASKKSFGLSSGYSITKKKFNFMVFGYLSLVTVYKSEYPYSIEDELLQLIYGNHVYIKNFDPNSWYKVSISYKIFDNMRLGIIAERFYMHGLFAEYDFDFVESCFDDFRFKVQIGRSLNNQESISLGFVTNIF